MLPALLSLALLAPLPLSAWGRRGHAKVALLALQDLPPEVATWFQGQEGVLRDHASDPDAWKSDPREGRRHFLDVDAYGGADRVPVDLKEATDRLGAEGVQKAGLVTWVIQDRMRDLAEAFKAGDPAKVAFMASILSHYVGDLHVPLHTCADYDGAGGQKGVHSRWETGLVDQVPGDPEVRPAVLEKDLFLAPFRWLRQSNGLAAKVLADDRNADPSAVGGSRSGSRSPVYWMRFTQSEGPVVREQLALAGQHTAQMILLAWNLAGKPKAPPR